jgi:hypothetical protein
MRHVRIGFALAGFGAALFSVALDDRRLGWVAIALLVIALILRLLDKRGNDYPRGDPSV